jgi:hypothetical protein
MNRKGVSIIALVVLFTLSAFVRAQYSSSLNVVLATQNPYPVEPGKQVNLELEIQNNGYRDANDVRIEIIPNDVFKLLPGESATKSFNKISASGSVKTTFKMVVDESVTSNDYEIEIRNYVGLTDAYGITNIAVSVQGTSELLLDLETVPEHLEPSGRARIIATIKNVGTGAAKQMKASLDSGSEDIIPLLAGGTVFVGDIAPGEEKQASLEFMIDSSAEYKTYVTTLTLNYKDESNTQQQKIYSVGIPITGTIKLDIIKMEPNYARGRLDIEVANKGTTDAKSLEAVLVINNETVGIDYLSQLKSTKKTTFSFPLVYKGDGYLMIDYIGPGLEENSIKEDIVLRFQPQGGDGTTSLITLILIAVVGYFAWKKYFRKKKKK